MPRCKSIRNGGYYSRNKNAFTSAFVATSRITRNLSSESSADVRFTRNDVFSLLNTSIAWRPFKGNLCESSIRINDSHVSLFFLTCHSAGIANRPLASIDSCFFTANDIPQAHPSSIRLNKMLIIIHFQIKFTGIWIQERQVNYIATFNFEMIMPSEILSSTKDLNREFEKLEVDRKHEESKTSCIYTIIW